jgi:hypothetical protein
MRHHRDIASTRIADVYGQGCEALLAMASLSLACSTTIVAAGGVDMVLSEMTQSQLGHDHHWHLHHTEDVFALTSGCRAAAALSQRRPKTRARLLMQCCG